MIIPRFGISRRRHLPVFKLLDHSISPFAAPGVIRQFWRWGLDSAHDSDLVKISTPLDELHLSRDRAGMMLYEWNTWRRCYTPPGFDFRGKTILDVGAGEGETVELYRLQGARRFICVEPDQRRASRLRENSTRNGWDVEVREEAFSLDVLKMQFDFMKMDCEGCESALIGVPLRFPCALELHGSPTIEEFLKMESFVSVKRAGNTALVTNIKSH